MRPKDWFSRAGTAPKKSLGQNFLTDRTAAIRIAEAATQEMRSVLEIGGGLGALTAPLVERCDAVIAIERDDDLAAHLAEHVELALASSDAATRATLEVVHADALELDWAALLTRLPAPRCLAGNVPYLITGALLERAVAHRQHLSRAVFMVQREVADRVAAPPGSRTYGALSVFAQAAFSVSRIRTVKRGSFYPVPNVDSAVIRLDAIGAPRAHESPAFREVVRRGFSQRRKTLRNAWKGLFGWTAEQTAAAAETAGISLDQRAETLPVEAFAAMAELAPASFEPHNLRETPKPGR